MPVVLVEGIGFEGEVGNEEVHVVVAVVVAEVYPHTSFGMSVLVIAGTRRKPCFGEGACLILVEEVHRSVVGHIDIGVSIAVVIRKGYPQTAPCERNAGLAAYIGKVAVVVAVENIADRGISGRLAIGTGFTLFTNYVV